MAANVVSRECDDTELLTCPVCLELFMKPVMLDCGHNFCKSCIEEVWDSTDKVPGCPECREEFKTRKCTVNWLLAKQVEAVKLRTGSTEGNSVEGRPPSTDFCEQHEEKLKLFCREDETLVCIICRDSAKHAGHSFLPVGEAASLHRGKITKAQADLQPRIQELVELQTKQEENIMDIKDHASSLEQHIRSEFAVMYQFLQEREQSLIQKLKDEEAETLRKMEDNLRGIKEKLTTFEKMMSDIQSTLGHQDAVAFLTAVSNISQLCNSVEQTGSRCKPDLISGNLSFWHFTGPLQYSVWKEMKSIITPVPASLFLDSNTAHRDFVLSQDLTSVVKANPYQNMSQIHAEMKAKLDEISEMLEMEKYNAVLASQGFSSGRHYWEVEVGDNAWWFLGVAAKSVIKEGSIPLSVTFGHWAICLKAGSKYFTCEQVLKLLSLSINPHKIGVYLDYEGGQISFYNADNMTHIHTFSDTFKECLYPSFSPNFVHHCSKPLKLFHLKL